VRAVVALQVCLTARAVHNLEGIQVEQLAAPPAPDLAAFDQ
jgi:hypothetical protein